MQTCSTKNPETKKAKLEVGTMDWSIHFKVELP